ncbi:nuclease-related domain-containing protein [Nocardia gipuzkoensis]
MRVINADRDKIAPTEKQVIGWLQKWTDGFHIPGIAISGCYVPDRKKPDDGQEADLVVITPQTCVVIEVKGILPRVSGVLSCTANGRWSLSGTDEPPVHVRKGDMNPIGQVTDGYYNLKDRAEKVGIDAFVAGMVLVVPREKYPVTLDWSGPKPKGCEVLLADYSGLRQYFHRRAARHEPSWTAERVHTLLTALNYGTEITVAQLVAEGFTAERPQSSSRVPEPDPWLAPVTPLPAARPPAPPTPPPPAAPQRPVDLGRSSADTADYSYEPTTPVRATAAPSRRRHGVQALGAVAAVGLIVGGVWVLALVRTDAAEPQRTSNEITSITEEPPVAPPPPSAEAPVPAPPASRGCYPFQANC